MNILANLDPRKDFSSGKELKNDRVKSREIKHRQM